MSQNSSEAFANTGSASIANDLLELINGGASVVSASVGSVYGSASTATAQASTVYSSSSYGLNSNGSVSYGSTSSASASIGNNIATDLLTLVQGSGSAAVSGEFLSAIEQAILRASNPIEITESEELTVLGQRGIWINRSEVNAWRGDIAITEYRIYEDSNPQIITKKVQQQIEYVQELAIRYLRPPTPPAPGEIIITQEPNIATGPAPPLIIRQAAARAETPEPLVIREAPPEPPKPIGPKRIVISGKRIPPPPRKVVIERLAALPSRPQNVIIERWLPYSEGGKRRVIFNRAVAVPEAVNPRNVVVQWEAPDVLIRKEVKYLGVIRANPVEYVQRYGAELKVHNALPSFVQEIATPREIGQLAWEFTSANGGVFELEGDLDGFGYINLDSEGLAEYRAQLLAKGIRDLGAVSISASTSASTSVAAAASQIFSLIDKDNSGEITIDEAESIVLKLNTRLNRSYGEAEVKSFFSAITTGNTITRVQFLQAFERLAA